MGKTQSTMTSEKIKSTNDVRLPIPLYITIKHAIGTGNLILAISPIVTALVGINSALGFEADLGQNRGNED
jgi:hypothetical protein